MKRIAPTLGTNLRYRYGYGYFANAMYLRGWQVEAVEKVRHTVHLPKHFNPDVKSEEALPIFRMRVLMITLWHVMEHLQNLQNTWERLSDLLSERGILVVAVPLLILMMRRSMANIGRRMMFRVIYGEFYNLHHAAITNGSEKRFILAARHPMPFDAFYVSMLKWKNREAIQCLL